MATEAMADDVPLKKSKNSLIIGLFLALIGAGVGFYATWSGAILGHSAEDHVSDEKEGMEVSYDDFAFVEVDPLTISVDSQPERRMLRFRAQLEVPKSYQDDVIKVLPRVVDVLNSYLRALEVSDLEDQSALTRLRAQMLRRVQVVTGQGRVNDLLIMEFILT